VRVVLALFVALVAFPAPAPVAAQRALVIERFDAAITVNQDGTVDVTETISPRFTGKWNGIYRTIPVKYRTPQGFNWTLRLKLVSVTDQSGQALRTESSRERHYVKHKIYVPGAEDATRTVVLRYRAENGLRFFEDHDELYWNVTGDEWEVPIDAATATITLPNGAEGVRAIAFNGAYGSTARDASVEQDGPTIRIAMPHRLAFHEGLTAVVGWNKGLVAEPTRTDRAVGFFQSNWPLGLPIVAFFGMFALWRRHGRDPKPLPIPVQYEPPADLTPAEAGTLMDNSADMRDLTATLVDLAVQGHLRIEEREERKLLGLIKDQEFVFHRLEPPAEARELAPHEQRVLSGVFTGGATMVELSDLENEFYTSLPGIKRRIFDRLIARGYYRKRPQTVQGAWAGGGIAAGVLIGVAGTVALAPKFSLTPVPFIMAGALVAIIVVAFGLLMPARTVVGARAREKVLGFEDFLHRVESDKYQRVVRTPEMFERFLPFAMAFGVEKQWANAFQDIFREPPRWYSGNLSTFNAGDFSGRMSAMSSRAASTMSSSPRSSGGSGFSGGSSGGGGGGGGGGGF
jgi:uncharacterized membrane protein